MARSLVTKSIRSPCLRLLRLDFLLRHHAESCPHPATAARGRRTALLGIDSDRLGSTRLGSTQIGSDRLGRARSDAARSALIALVERCASPSLSGAGARPQRVRRANVPDAPIFSPHHDNPPAPPRPTALAPAQPCFYPWCIEHPWKKIEISFIQVYAAWACYAMLRASGERPGPNPGPSGAWRRWQAVRSDHCATLPVKIQWLKLRIGTLLAICLTMAIHRRATPDLS